MNICGGSVLLLLDMVNRRERQEHSMREFCGGGGRQRHATGLSNKIDVEDSIYQ